MDNAVSFVLFGGTGDLTKRKLIPALYNLYAEHRLGSEFLAVLIGRRDKTREQFEADVLDSITQFSRKPADEGLLQDFLAMLDYFKMSFDDPSMYPQLDDYLKAKRMEASGSLHEEVRVYKLAVAPRYFEVITGLLGQYGMQDGPRGRNRLLIEKPFGKDLASARELSQFVTSIFGEEHTFRIDHYLGKEMLQNILPIRFGNGIFEPLWNNKYIDKVEICAYEKDGVGTRAGYYDSNGALKDMVQNHLLQLLAIIAMEPPVDLDAHAIRHEKVKVLKRLRKYDETSIHTDVVRGQYGPGVDGAGNPVIGYLQEDGVPADSHTETFVAAKVFIDNYRWLGIPFYLTTGKRMHEKRTEVVITFKNSYGVLFPGGTTTPPPSNQMIISIQPEEGVHFRFNAKKVGETNILEPVQMQYCKSCQVSYNSPESYETILLAVFNNDGSNFTSWEELENSWAFVDSINDMWQATDAAVETYPAGMGLPDKVIELFESIMTERHACDHS